MILRFVLFFLLPFYCLSQNKCDSILTVLKTKKIHDTTRCNLLLELIDSEFDNTIWINYNTELTNIALSNKNKNYKNKILFNFYSKKLADSYINNGAYLVYKNDIPNALINYNKAKQIHISCGNILGEAICYQDIGIAYEKVGALDSALFFLNKGYAILQKLNNTEEMAYALTDIGFVYKTLGFYSKAIDYNLRSIDLFKLLKDEQGLERCYFAIAKIFYAQAEIDKALLYYNNALLIALKTKNYERQSKIYDGIANCYLKNKNYNTAKKNIKKALDIAVELNMPEGQSSAYFVLGNIAFQELKFDSAKVLFLKMYAIGKTYNIKFDIAKSTSALSTIYLEKGNDGVAKKYALESLIAATEVNSPPQIIEIGKTLLTIYEKEKDYKKLSDILLLIKKNKEIVDNDLNKNIALKKEFEYQSNLKETALLALSQQQQITKLESKRKSILLYSIIGGALAMALVSYFLFTRYKTKKQNEFLKAQLIEANKTIEAEKKATESELKALKSQMNPHFIFNALNSIQEQFMYGDKILANEQMGNFTYLTRQILNVSGKKKITIATEIDILTKYLELEKVRFKDDFTFEITCGTTIDEDYHQLPPMLIQPFVENSMKHGLLHKQGKKNLAVNYDLSPKEDCIICTVIDNGVGRKKSAEIKIGNKNTHPSFSTNSIEQRLELLNSNLNLTNLISYTDITNEANEIEGTKVEIKIPLY